MNEIDKIREEVKQFSKENLPKEKAKKKAQPKKEEKKKKDE